MKTIREYIEEYEVFQKRTLGRRHAPLPEYYKQVLEDFGLSLLETSPGYERESFLGALDHIKIKVAREFRQEEDRNYEEKRKREQSREEEFQPKLLKWARQNLTVGMKLKMKGCRDGNGYREVIELDMNNDNPHARITCRKLVFRNTKFWKDNHITTHGIDKILGPLKISDGCATHTSLRKIL